MERKYLEYFEGAFDSTVAEKIKPENKPYVAYSESEGVIYTVIPQPIPETLKIYYTSSDGQVITPQTGINVFGANIVSNTYENGQGVIIFDSDVTAIGLAAFSEAYSLTSIIIPNSVTYLGPYAFADCRNLENITIGSGVTSIHYRTFVGIYSALSSITCLAVVPPTYDGDTTNLYGSFSIYVPAESVEAYKTANFWSLWADTIQAIPS